jgi:hypothetical protein
MEKVKYRLINQRLAPRRTKLEIPGWAGGREPRANGSHEQVWHCDVVLCRRRRTLFIDRLQQRLGRSAAFEAERK